MTWIWAIFFLIYVLYNLLSVTYFFYHESMMHEYYQILIAYDLYYLFPYLLNALSVILNVLSLVPFYLFLFKISFLDKYFWRYFLLAKLAADLTGRSFEWSFLKSLYYAEPQVAFSVGGTIVLVSLPAYLALLCFAFPDASLLRTNKNSS